VEALAFCHKDIPLQRSTYSGGCHFGSPFERSALFKLYGRPNLVNSRIFVHCDRSYTLLHQVVAYNQPFIDRFAHNLKSMDPPVRLATRGDTLSGDHALLATIPQRGRNPLRAGITGEDEIGN